MASCTSLISAQGRSRSSSVRPEKAHRSCRIGCHGLTMRYVKHMANLERGTERAEMEVADGCSLCDGPVAVKFSRSRAVSVCRACKHVAYCQPPASPPNRRLILPISSALSASAALASAAACFDVLVFDPKTTVPPITAD